MTFLLVIAAVAALALGVVFVLRGSLIAGCLVFLLVVNCFGHEFVNFDAGPLPLTLDRLVLVLLAGMYVVHRRFGRTESKPLAGTDWLILVFLAVLAASTFRVDWRTAPLGDTSPLFRLIGAYVIPFLLFWMARQSRLSERELRCVYAALTLFGVYLGVTALCEIAGQWSLVFPHYIADPTVGLHHGRARGPMVHSVSFGLYLAASLLCAWFWRGRLGRAGQLAVLLVLPLFLAGILFSYTRSVWMGTALGLVICVGPSLSHRWRIVALGGALMAGLMVSLVNIENLVGFQREGSASDTRKSVSMRGSFTYVSWKMFQDRPVFGFGMGQFKKAKLPYLEDRSTELNLESIRDYGHHNMYLSLLTEAGLIGCGLFLAVLGGWFRTAWTIWRTPQLAPWAREYGLLFLGILCIYAVQGLFHDLSYTPLDHSLLFFLAGLLSGLRPLIDAPALAEAPQPCAVELQPA